MTERPPLPHDPAKVKAELQRRVLDVLLWLDIRDMPANGLVTPLNPRRRDRSKGSFVIWTETSSPGSFKDYAVANVQGDIWGLIEYLGQLDRWIDAYWWALDKLNWGRGVVRSASQDRLDRERQEADRLAAKAREGAELDAKAAKARGFWLSCAKMTPGDLAWIYLSEARGLPLGGPKVPPFNALRFNAEVEHTDGATGEITEWPAMVSAMSHWETGQVRAAHRTYLAPSGLAKAPVANAKKMMGVASGCAVRISKGAGNLSPEEAGRRGVTCPLIITEGIEDAGVAAIARPGDRVWAAGSLSLMGLLGWPACASAVVLVADNDWDKPQAVAAFEKVEAHWRDMAAGRPLKVVRAQVGKDLNDWARGEG